MKPNLSWGISSILMIPNLSPGSIFNIPSPYEKFSMSDDPVTSNFTAIFSVEIEDK